MATKESNRRQLSKIISGMLGRPCPVPLLKEIAPEILEEARPGQEGGIPRVIEMLAKKIVRLALDPKKANQWAVELIYDRMEGKSTLGKPLGDDGRNLEDRLDEIATQHLNDIAEDFVKNAAEGSDSQDEAFGPAESELEMSSDGLDSPEDDEGQPLVAEEVTETL